MVAPRALNVFVSHGQARIYRLRLRAFPDFSSWAYLVRQGDYLMLIDAGAGTETSNRDLAAGLRAAGASGGSDLTHVLVTHGHIDHFGGLPFLRESSQAQIGLHELALQTVSHHEAHLQLGARRRADFLTRAGVAAPQLAQLLETYRFTSGWYVDTQPDFTFSAVDMQIGPLRLLHVPGHSPGQVALRLDDVVFLGDHVLPHIVPHLTPTEVNGHSGLWQYLQSLDALLAWAGDCRLALAGHGEPIMALPQRVMEIRARLAERLTQTLALLARPSSVAELAARLYGENFTGYDALLVLEKTGAYVEYLYQRGLITLDALDDEGVFRYRRLKMVDSAQILPKEKRHDVFLSAN